MNSRCDFSTLHAFPFCYTDRKHGSSQSPLKKKLDIFARTCYRIISGIKQAHTKNDQLYKKVLQRPIRDQIRVRKLKFTGHILRMNKEEQANIHILYEIGEKSWSKSNHWLPRSNINLYYNINKTSIQITRMAKDKMIWLQSFPPKKPTRWWTWLNYKGNLKKQRLF